VRPTALGPLLSKRASGWLSWQLRRRKRHRASVLEALVGDLQQTGPDHVVITGDLTNVALEEEFHVARAWLERLGPPARVAAVPGNHDAYVAVPQEKGWGLWADYLASDDPGAAFRAQHCETVDESIAFPSLRLLGSVAVLGLCSAHPTGWFQASGSVGAAQLADAEALLAALGREGFTRVVLLHHPPRPGVVSDRRALKDAAALCEMLARAGAELVLHGHLHRTRFDAIPAATGEIPVVGVRSASDFGSHPEKQASYHLYEIEEGGGKVPITVRAREYDANHDRFTEGAETRRLDVGLR
jgi:3',5'-cyclic AMP phosphodiesterase CpdA